MTKEIETEQTKETETEHALSLQRFLIFSFLQILYH